LPFTGWNFIESVDTQITGNVFPVDLKRRNYSKAFGALDSENE
jgi:hypothetical protein